MWCKPDMPDWQKVIDYCRNLQDYKKMQMISFGHAAFYAEHLESLVANIDLESQNYRHRYILSKKYASVLAQAALTKEDNATLANISDQKSRDQMCEILATKNLCDPYYNVVTRLHTAAQFLQGKKLRLGNRFSVLSPELLEECATAGVRQKPNYLDIVKITFDSLGLFDEAKKPDARQERTGLRLARKELIFYRTCLEQQELSCIVYPNSTQPHLYGVTQLIENKFNIAQKYTSEEDRFSYRKPWRSDEATENLRSLKCNIKPAL